MYAWVPPFHVSKCAPPCNTVRVKTVKERMTERQTEVRNEQTHVAQ